MSFQDIVKKWMEYLSPDNKQEKDSQKIEKLDAKVVFQDTKKSLEALKQNIFSSSDQVKKQEQEHHVFQYIDRLLWFSVLSEHDKTFLNQLKQNILSKNSLQETDLESIITIVSHLEQKAENLNEVDQEKVKELHDTLSQHKTSLDLLKKGVAAVAPTLEEAKKKAFETMKKDLEQHRWSSWLAQPVYDYLMDKHVHKKSVSKFKEFLIGTVGLTVVGWFVGKDIKNLIANIDTLNVEDIVNNWAIIDVIDETKQEVIDKLTKAKEKYQKKMFDYFEKKFGKKIEKEKFDKLFSEWFEDNKKLFNLSEKYDEAIAATHWNWEFNVLAEWFWLIIAPGKAIFDLLVRMKKENIISWNDIVIDGVILPSWKAILNVGIWSVWLFYNTMKTVFWSLSSDDLLSYLKESNNKLDLDSKMAIWWMLYRRGWWFWNLAGHIWNAVGEWMSLLFTQRTWWDVGKISAYWKWWVMSNVQKELQVLKQLEDWLIWTWVFKEMNNVKTSTILENILDVAKKNTLVVDVMQNLGNNMTYSDLVKKLKQEKCTEVIDELQKFSWWPKNNLSVKIWGDEMKSLKKIAWDFIENKSMEPILKQAEDTYWTVKKFFAKNIKLPGVKFPYEFNLIDNMRDMAKIQGKSLQSDEIFHTFKNFFRKFKKWKILSEVVWLWDDAKLVLKNVDDAKEFFDNIRTIWKHSPEVLKTLFKWLPLVMMWKDIMDKLSDPEHKDEKLSKMIWQWFQYLIPLRWPIKLIEEGVTLKEWWFTSLTSAGVGVWLLTLDWIYAFKAGLQWWSQLLKFMTAPVIDALQFMKSVWNWVYMTCKMAVDGVRIIKAWKSAELWIEALRFLKWSWLRFAGMALLAYLWYVGIKELFWWLSQEEKQQLAKIETLSKEDLEAEIETTWKDLDDDQKSSLIKFATATRMWISDFNDIESKKNWDDISLRFKRLINYNEMKEIEQDLQISLSRLESTKNVKLDFSLHGWEVKYELLAMKKNNFIDKNWIFDEQWMKNYLMTMWYNQEMVDELMEKIV